MRIKVICPHCGAAMLVRVEDDAGSISCAKCGGSFGYKVKHKAPEDSEMLESLKGLFGDVFK